VTSQHQRTSRAAELAVERARYEADRAERAFSQVEPENRLVARTLETRWEAKLAAAGQALAAAQDALPPLPDRASLEKLAAGLPALWHAPTTTPRDRKRLLRTLIADVTLLPEANRAKARIGIRWHTGAADEIVIDRPRSTGVPAPTPTPATALIRELGPVTSNTDLVTLLAQRGYRTGAGRPFDIKAVQWVRHAYQIPSPSPCRDTEISVAEAARRLGCSPGVVYYWIETGQLDARRSPGGRLCIPWTPATDADCRARITSSGHLNPAARRTRPRQHR
jgi:excisionase family DNA binding protein